MKYEGRSIIINGKRCKNYMRTNQAGNGVS